MRLRLNVARTRVPSLMVSPRRVRAATARTTKQRYVLRVMRGILSIHRRPHVRLRTIVVVLMVELQPDSIVLQPMMALKNVCLVMLDTLCFLQIIIAHVSIQERAPSFTMC